MSESAAITLHLADLTGRDDLVPGPRERERAAFLRWLVFLVANVYPTFTYGDLPERFVTTAGRGRPSRRGRRLRAPAVGHRRGGGRRAVLPRRALLALDIYLAVMTRWRPGRSWFPNMRRACSPRRRAPRRSRRWRRCQRNFPAAS